MNMIDAMITGHTCGPACWEAREDICRCSCGGKNHGCLRHAGGIRPLRQSRIDGVMYELAEVGASEIEAARTIATLRNGGDWWYGSIREKGAELRIKAATRSQVQSWPELAAYRSEMYAPNLLWRRLDVTLPTAI